MSRQNKWIIFLILIFGLSFWLVKHYSIVRFSETDNVNPIKTYNSIIVESNAIRDVLDYVKDQQTIVVFDIDNTLVHPVTEVGSDQWFTYMIKQKHAMGMSAEQALASVLPLYFQIQDQIDQQPVEENTVEVIRSLQHKNIITLALTSRSLPLIKRTEDQLEKAGISFKSSSEFDRQEPFTLERPAMLSHGIIYCNNNSKGHTLLHVLELCHCNPKVVVFVDDKLSHLFEVEKECLINKIRFVGIRYGKLDDLVTQFDPIRADEQLVSLFGNGASGELVSA